MGVVFVGVVAIVGMLIYGGETVSKKEPVAKAPQIEQAKQP